MALPIIVIGVILGLGLLSIMTAMGSAQASAAPILLCSSGCKQAAAMYHVTPDGIVTALNGARHYGDLQTSNRTPEGRITHLVVTSDHCGYWMLDSNGRAYLFGNANHRSLANHIA
jgi:hypothetical protein